MKHYALEKFNVVHEKILPFVQDSNLRPKCSSQLS